MSDAPDALSASLERVLTRFADRVRRIGARYRLAGDDLDELFQQVRLRLWRARGTGDAIDSAPASYVYRTAVSAALDLIRRRQAKREVPIDPPEGSGPEPAAPETTEQRLSDDDLAATVAAAIDGIAASRRPAVRMHLAGYGPDEIGAALGCDRTKARNLVYRGLADLRERLREKGVTGSEGPWNG
ncbi:MAG: sigma-70 family RNA polymerase sigma factor [Gemmatimonadetes bacterium]|nr:sigma-70 family RNA polymerase sigma factor [Gemmatimonadota bacterium]